jgi:hypothetical protein
MEVFKEHLTKLDMTSDHEEEKDPIISDDEMPDEDGDDTLADHLASKFRVAVDTKERLGITCRLRNAWYALNQKYTPEQLCKIQTKKGADVFYGLTAMQRRSALAWYEDLLSQIKLQPWKMSASPVAELPAEARDEIINKVTQRLLDGAINPDQSDARAALKEESALTVRLLEQRAESIAARHEKIIADQLSDGGWADAFSEFRIDLFTYCNAILVSPEAQPKRVMEYSGKKVKVKDTFSYTVRSVSPFAVFPLPDVTTPNTGEGIFVVDEVSANSLIGIKSDKINAFPDEIDEVLRSNPDGWWAGKLITNKDIVEAEGGYFASRELSGSDDSAQTYSVVRFYGDIPDKLAFKIGVIKKKEVIGATIPVQVMMCGSHIIWAAKNQHPLGHRPIHTASYETLPRSFWGNGLHDLLSDTERQLNKALRELVAHTASTLGYFGELDMQRMGKNPIGNSLQLNQILRTDGDYTRGGHPALRFHSLDSKIGEIIRLIQHYSQMAEDLTGIRRFMSGATDLGVAGRTNGVVNALQTNSSKLIVMVQGNVNKNVIKPAVEYLYHLNMMFHKDSSIKGDLNVVVEGSDGLAKQEIFDQRLEKILQYGSTLLAPGPDGTTLIDPNDIRELIGKYFSVNGFPLQFTVAPSESGAGVTAPGATLGDGGMPAIDGRSNPVNISGGAGPIPAVVAQ